MSGTLSFRKTPQKWNGYFKLPLRDKIYNYVKNYSHEQVDSNDLSYFQGMRDAAKDKDDIRNLEKIIEILENGDTVDFKMEY